MPDLEPKRLTTDEELSNRHAYHAPKNDATVMAHAGVRNKTLELALWLNQILPECPEKTVALNHVREAMMYGNAAIALHSDKL